MRLFQNSHFSFLFEYFLKIFLEFFKMSPKGPTLFFDILQQTGFPKS